MSSRSLLILATIGSALMMIGALGFQYIGQMPPCKLCYWQRYPHIAAVAIGMLALWTELRTLSVLGMVAALTTAAIGLYHTGVERAWWEGPTSCTSSGTSGISGEDLMAQIMSAPMVRCDEVPWELLSLSMASWNAIASLGLAALWGVSLVRK